MVLAWVLSGGFCDVDLYFVVVAVLHLPFFFIRIFFLTSSLTLPWTIARFLDPFCTFSPAHRRVVRDTFIFQPFRYLLTASATVWVGIFYPQAFFALRSFPTFWHNLLLSRFCWEPAATFLKVAGLHTDPRNTDLVHLFVWFTAKVLLMVKTLIRSAATLFSNHENIKQQPN